MLTGEAINVLVRLRNEMSGSGKYEQALNFAIDRLLEVKRHEQEEDIKAMKGARK